jgi:penicillin G amidase
MRIFTILLISLCAFKTAANDSISIQGLKGPVQITIDRYGVSHITAFGEEDLFFAQGWNAARDRLFQFEMWRMQASGSAAAVLGEHEVKRDIGARLFKFRGDMTKEMNHYHPRGAQIIRAFVKGINAYIRLVLDGKEPLPAEFKSLGIQPQYWTEEIVISRHQGLLANVQDELRTAREVMQYGADAVKKYTNYHPNVPDLSIDPFITKEILDQDILAPYNAFRTALKFSDDQIQTEHLYDGSNNWVLSGSKTKSGFPVLANDPHRAITVPSLRYITHLKAPGWDVIGGGEPTIPGISIGHNEYGAWGLTIFNTDAEDLFIYKLNPKDSTQYWYQGKWKKMIMIPDTILVKDKPPVYVTHKYTIHGPVTYLNGTTNVAAAVQCAWLERGSAPYLASLRMNQARSWDDFKNACKYSFIPAENMIWADRKGNIGWQVVGITPVRKTHSGMVPVPGDGRFKWEGFLPVLKRPGKYNPASGFIATANQHVTEDNYPHKNTLSYIWADPYRGDRINEVLKENKKFTLSDSKDLQTDYRSLPAKAILPLLLNAISNETDDFKKQIIVKLKEWNHVLSPESVGATIYQEFENQIKAQIIQVLPNTKLNNLSTVLAIKYLQNPELIFTHQATEKRDKMISLAFTKSVEAIKERLGDDITNWQYGQAKNKHSYLTHPLSTSKDKKWNDFLNVGPLPRGGYENTVGSTGSSRRQTSGASFRIVVDLKDWDSMIATNSPGQSGNPSSSHYRDLFDLWAEDEYFPLYYSKEKIESIKERDIVLTPVKK